MKSSGLPPASPPPAIGHDLGHPGLVTKPEARNKAACRQADEAVATERFAADDGFRSKKLYFARRHWHGPAEIEGQRVFEVGKASISKAGCGYSPWAAKRFEFQFRDHGEKLQSHGA